MNKNQWYALSFCFMMCGVGFIGISGLYGVSFTVSYTTANPFVFARAIVDGIATILVHVCYMAAIACWVCGRLEKEEAK